MAPWVSAKAKVQLRLAIQRLRTLQEKKSAQAKTARRDIALLLEKGKIETARIKVENIIHEDIYVELLELLELYCELLHARFSLLDQNTKEPDPGVSEGVCSVVYAAPRTELKELHVLREMLMHKYGREFSVGVMENRDGCVNERVAKKLVVFTPAPELVDAYLAEIAKGYGVKWTAPSSTSDSDDTGGEGGVKESSMEKTPAAQSPMSAEKISAEARSAGVRTPKLPELPPTEDDDEPKAPAPVDEFEALAKRFEALKKR
ncbi:DUF292-domain-containing protein [Rhodofomes roseus]|uniref:DUF292-domain-containing protein n=1 Tax=Rhodofomes roseus TaxID=34475 RepID=A0ABQ8KHL3_9APHY|nr:DUF292-domain-containing protein [Rhodofomes roseus]KAH9837323.1 DUF292-domain-containing protein [Rhodofomes roseus]